MCPLLSVRFYSFYFFIRFSMNIFFTEVLLSSVVGSSGLEPPTSRLSGARSNHLSYEPIKLFRCISSLSPIIYGFCRWWRWWDSNPWPPACRAGALPTELHPRFWEVILTVTENWTTKIEALGLHRAPFTHNILPTYDTIHSWKCIRVSIERRWSSRTFRYGYLVTT